MLKDVSRKYYLENNYNCAETIIRAANDYYELGLHDRDMIMVASYGAGIMTGNTCGAVLGAAAALSMKYVETKAHESDEIRPVTVKLIRKFNEKYGSVLCRDIKPQSFTKEDRCLFTIENASDILEAVIEEFEKERMA